MDTDIKNTDLPANGTYIIQVSANNTADSIWNNYWSGIMSWYKDGTKRDFYFGSEEEREKSASWHLNSLNVERVNCFELGEWL